MRRYYLACAHLALLLASLTSTAQAQGLSAWERGGQLAGVDPLILYAIALTESGKRGPSGRGVVAWPWTLNTPARGGEYFATQEEAAKALRSYIDRGWVNIDIGLGQVNWRWNGRRMTDDAVKLLDPETNILAAAQVLRNEMRDHAGDLWRAVGHYHNPKNPRRDRYSAKVRRTYYALLQYNPDLLTSASRKATRLSYLPPNDSVN